MALLPNQGDGNQKYENSKPNLQPHPSLPAKPPPSSQPPPPSFRPNNAGARGYGNNNAVFGGFAPRSVVSRAPPMSAAPSYAPTMMTSQAPANGGGYQPNSYQTQVSYYQQPNNYVTSTPPQIVNPYPLPGQAGRALGRNGAYDPEYEAQIAEWNSAYTTKDDANKKAGQSGFATNGNANAIPLGNRPNAAMSGEAGSTPDAEGVLSAAGAEGGGKQKTVVRQGGGKSWEDPSLLEWDPLHPRLFVGNLAGEVTDESLLKAFSKYASVSKARVVREKRTTKSKSYGFVSFGNTDDYFRAAKEMQGKYIGSHPVRISRANTEIKATSKQDHKHGRNGQNGKKGGGGGHGGASGFGGGGIQKYPQQKGHKSGPKMLG
ncbi:RNA-binding domain-containing protein [Zopfia rhizophila CBS 207.26]|uniref:RNA-binding domain-containing protein n=1 Tax=Zopfia rhizophila CBS 207.26 TaxID=1314779 RepID=A0A6A6EWU3_9PEZI|nr:RNA-binding domain-containing protein [Zopfia rhizophila CBS 207.26]